MYLCNFFFLLSSSLLFSGALLSHIGEMLVGCVNYINTFSVHSQAKAAASAQDKWLLVNLQSTTEFSSHMVTPFSYAALCLLK